MSSAGPSASKRTSACGSNLLLLVLGDGADEALRGEVEARSDSTARIHVVAPAIEGPLAWLATADDEPHRRAEARLLSAEWTLADDGDVDGEAGDPDPVQAVADALRAFPADEILVAGPADADLESALRAFGLPVARVDTAELRERSLAYRALRSLAAGRNGATPFVLFLAVNGVLLAVGLLLGVLVLIVLRLGGFV